MRRISKRYLTVIGILSLSALSLHFLFRDPCTEAEWKLYNLRQDSLESGLSSPSNGSVTMRDILTDDIFPERTDWHDYNQTKPGLEKHGTGPRIIGHGLSQPACAGRPCDDQYGYFHIASRSIPLNRSLVDTRLENCKKKMYLRGLPKVSLVLTFSDEHISVLRRAVYSIKLRTPHSLVAEIILVQMSSSKFKDSIAEEDRKAVEATLRYHHPDLVFDRTPSNSGIAQARMTGSRRASGDILVFLQLPFEVNVNWLPPLIEPIVIDERIVTCPIIDRIDPNTFQYRSGVPPHGSRTGFDWNFTIQQLKKLSRGDNDEPYRTPIMEGRVFAIHKTQFLELGGYDPKLKPGGSGEQLDLSFKVWLCGGEILYIPCSRVGLVDKIRRTIPANLSQDDIVNFKRIARIWLPQYAEFVLMEIEDVAVGDLGAQINLQERLACKPFRWFLEKVVPDCPPLKPFTSHGVIQSVYSQLCATVKNTEKRSIGMELCELPEKDRQTRSLELTSDGHITLPERNMCLALQGPRNIVTFEPCSSLAPAQVWVYDRMNKNLAHNNSNRCLAASTNGRVAFIEQCTSFQRTNANFRWNIAKDSGHLEEYTGRPA